MIDDDLFFRWRPVTGASMIPADQFSPKAYQDILGSVAGPSAHAMYVHLPAHLRLGGWRRVGQQAQEDRDESQWIAPRDPEEQS